MSIYIIIGIYVVLGIMTVGAVLMYGRNRKDAASRSRDREERHR